MTARSRRRASVLLVALTAVLLAGAVVSGYTRSEIVDSRAFSSRTASALDDRAVREILAARLVDALTRSAAQEALVVRPLAVAGVAALVGRPRVRSAFERAVRARHEVLMEGESRFVLRLTFDDRLLGTLVRFVGAKASALLRRNVSLPVVSVGPTAFELRMARGLADFAAWRWWLLGAGLLAAGACAALARSPRDAVARLGIAVAGAGLLVAAAVAGLGMFVVSHAAHALALDDDSERSAIGALWTALFGDLRTAGLLAAAGGVVVATLALGELTEARLAGAGRWARRTARAPGPTARRVRAGLMVALGAVLLLEPLLVLRLAAVTAGVLLALLGIAVLSGRAPVSRPAAAPRSASPLLLAATVAAVVVATVAAAVLVLDGPSPRSAAVAAPPGACNGAVALCGRRLDEVVFPATHNSYAAALQPGWFFANQRHGIARQLEDGIRAFTLDLHYGVSDPETSRIRTDLQAEGSSRNKVARELSPEALRTADELVGRVGAGRLDGPRRPYFCHTLCELGAEPQDEQWEIFARFLAANPREVLVLFIEPYVDVAEIERGLRDSGLLPYAAELRRDAALPTLRELIASGKRLVVFTEEDGGSRPWYLDGFSFVQDTPYQARRPSELRCDRFRGEPDSPLLLVNHWIATFPPSPRRNQRIAGRALERRLAQCERLRGQLPNLVAVDFYERSGVVRIAERLNARRP